MTNKNPLELANEALELADKATPAPWQITSRENGGIDAIDESGFYETITYQEGRPLPEDTDFIARSRTLVPELANALIEAHKEIEYLNQVIAQIGMQGLHDGGHLQ